MLDINDLIKQDTTDDNRFATALQEQQTKINQLEEAAKNATAALEEKNKSILSLKAKNFELLSNLTAEKKDDTIKDKEDEKDIKDILKEIYK